MAADPVTRFFGGGWRPSPWTVLFIGVGVTFLGLLLSLAGDALAPLRVIVLFAGLITVGSAVSLRLSTAGQQFEERMESAGVLAIAAFATLLAYWATNPLWDSMTMVLVVLIAAALAGVALVLLPTAVRMMVVGVLVLVHFGGMITAATTIDPPGASALGLPEGLAVVSALPPVHVLEQRLPLLLAGTGTARPDLVPH